MFKKDNRKAPDWFVKLFRAITWGGFGACGWVIVYMPWPTSTWIIPSIAVVGFTILIAAATISLTLGIWRWR